MSDPALPRPARRAFMLIAGLIGLGGLLIQAKVTWQLGVSRGWDAGTTLAKYFSYFTITTNLLLVAAHLIGTIFPHTKAGAFFNRPRTCGALFTYIAIVGIVYTLVLAGLWKPQGLQWWADVILHDVTPLLYALYWFIFVPKEPVAWKTALAWLPYPGIYLIWAVVHGHSTGHYAYPFLDLNALGIAGVAVNCGVMAGGFLAVGLGVIALGRWMAHRER